MTGLFVYYFGKRAKIKEDKHAETPNNYKGNNNGELFFLWKLFSKQSTLETHRQTDRQENQQRLQKFPTYLLLYIYIVGPKSHIDSKEKFNWNKVKFELVEIVMVEGKSS